MVKGKGEPCLSAVVQYRAERRPDRPADKEDTYGGYDMHFSLYTTLCPLQNVIPMLQIGFSGALRLIPTHFLRLPGIESAEETVCASRNASAVLSFAAHHCREQACPFRLLWFRRQFPVALTQQLYRQLFTINYSSFIGAVADRPIFAFPSSSARGRQCRNLCCMSLIDSGSRCNMRNG